MAEWAKSRFDGDGFRAWDAYLAIFHLDKTRVSELKPERTIHPVIEQLHADARIPFRTRRPSRLCWRGNSTS